MFLGPDTLPLAFAARAATSAVEVTWSARLPCSDLGFSLDGNLVFLRYCAQELWNYLQALERKAQLASSLPCHARQLAKVMTWPHQMPRSCRIGMNLLLAIARESVEAIRLLASAVHVQVSCTSTLYINVSLFFTLNAVVSPACASAWCLRAVPYFFAICRKNRRICHLDQGSIFSRHSCMEAASRRPAAEQSHDQLVCGSLRKQCS
jgi:hypothetical protein